MMWTQKLQLKEMEVQDKVACLELLEREDKLKEQEDMIQKRWDMLRGKDSKMSVGGGSTQFDQVDWKEEDISQTQQWVGESQREVGGHI